MRIVHVCRGLHDYVSGLANWQVETDEVHVCLSSGERVAAGTFSDNVGLHLTPMLRVRNPANLFRLSKLRALVDALEPDILHVQSGMIWENILLQDPRTYPVVLTVHDVVNHPSWGGALRPPEFLTRWAVNSADAIIVHGEANRQLLLRRYDLHLQTLQTFSVDHGVISRYGQGNAREVVPAGRGNVLFFGRLDKYKGVEYLIQAEARIREAVAEPSIVIAGASARPEYYTKLVGRGSKVSLRLGYHDREVVQELFRWADVIVLPYLEASQSGVYQIATSFGVPAVVTAVGGFTDVVDDRETGLLVAPRDAEALASAVCELLADTDLRRKIIRNLQKNREARFSGWQIASDTLKVYKHAINSFRDRVPNSASSNAILQTGKD